MTDLRKAAEMALDVLERASDAGYSIECEEAIVALRQALAQPEQEPVVWIRLIDWNLLDREREGYIPLYAAPPKREWVGLTEDEAIELLPVGDWEIESTLDFARAIEAKIREKNS